MSSYKRDDKAFRARMGELADHAKPAPSKGATRTWLVLGLAALGLLCPWLFVVVAAIVIISL